MIEVKANFSNGYTDVSCNICDQNEPQTQQHLLNCPEILKNCPELANNNEVVYSDLFENENRQLRCVRLFKIIINAKQKLQEDNN